MKLLFVVAFCFTIAYVYSQCCSGSTIGVCVNDICPNGTMCNNGWCCPGCVDHCYNCYQYIGYCNNPYYSCSMSCCQATCGKCFP